MSTKLAIYLTGKPNIRGHKIREFRWSPPHGIYLYEGRETPAEEFNEVYERAVRRNSDLSPKVKILSADGAPVPAVMAPIATIAREITVEDAEAVLQRLAPERLNKKRGRKPVAAAAVA